MKNRYPPEPKSLLTVVIDWILVCVAATMLIKYITQFLTSNWYILLIVVIIVGGTAGYRIYKRRKDQWY